MANKTGLIEKNGSLFFNGEGLGGASSAGSVSYDGDVAGAENVGEALDSLQTQVDSLAASTGGSTADYSEYGWYGQNYPAQMDIIQKQLAAVPDRLSFIHISDSHTTSTANTKSIGYADDLLANTPADFLVHTGDMVNDSINSNRSNILSMLYNAKTTAKKPVYIALGNHDVIDGDDNTDYFSMYFNDTTYPLAGATGYDGNAKTYYSVNIGTTAGYKFKIIVLDQYDGTTGTRTTNNAKMSTTQVDWLIRELMDAAQNYRNVAIFCHSQPGLVISKAVPVWTDEKGDPYSDGGNEAVKKVVDYFIKHTASWTFTYDGVEFKSTDYSDSQWGPFSRYNQVLADRKCGFIGWFCGHTHFNVAGPLDDYPDQFVVATATPYSGTGGTAGNYSPSYIPSINYVVVSPVNCTVSVLRCGEQRTVFGAKRDILTYRYRT